MSSDGFREVQGTPGVRVSKPLPGHDDVGNPAFRAWEATFVADIRARVVDAIGDPASAPRLSGARNAMAWWRWRGSASNHFSLVAGIEPADFGPILCGGTPEAAAKLALIVRDFADSRGRVRLTRAYGLGWIEEDAFLDNTVFRTIKLAVDQRLIDIRWQNDFAHCFNSLLRQ